MTVQPMAGVANLGASSRRPSQGWRGKGAIYRPDRSVGWMAGGAGAFFAEPFGEDRIRLFISGRDALGCSRIGSVILGWGRHSAIEPTAPELVFDLGDPGTFDMDGVGYPWITSNGDALFMYYVGWNRLGGTVPFRNQIGLAVSTDGGNRFRRISRAPLLPLTDAEPIGSGSCCVCPAPGGWVMYYTNFLRWEPRSDGARHYYHIRRAYSQDGINWERPGEVVIDLIAPDEYALAAPNPTTLDGRNALLFTARGHAYRLFIAVEREDRGWTRLPEPIELPRFEFDSEMQCYPRTMEMQGARYLLYAGNGYGREGIGCAVWKGQDPAEEVT